MVATIFFPSGRPHFANLPPRPARICTLLPYPPPPPPHPLLPHIHIHIQHVRFALSAKFHKNWRMFQIWD